jgi:AcrR family transcriptional regulator
MCLVTGSAGRPREFDRDQALERALLVFWEHGFDGTSIATLTDALGINPPSLYAAFGNKRKLFDEVVDRYVRTYGDYGARALQQPTARAAVQMLLDLAADVYTRPGHPSGCLVISGASSHAPTGDDAAQRLHSQRESTKRALAEKIRADIEAGVLPADADADALAAFYAATIQGMNTQALDGATRSELQAIGELAMRAWPT